MYNHEPKDYKCPLCGASQGTDDQATRQSDVFYRDEFMTAFIAPKWWPNNPGHVIIIPNQHIENIYDISDELLSKIYALTKKIAIALKEVYRCAGTSTRQHNEPTGSQDVWHFHVHIFPRYTNDNLYEFNQTTRWTEPEERMPYADKLREYFKNHQ